MNYQIRKIRSEEYHLLKDFLYEAIVAEVDHKIIGAVWVRIMNDYGHIDDDTPSFAISLYENYRKYGIGTALMKEMLKALEQEGYKQASLSVQKDNYAVKLYKNLGFEIVDETAEEYIMKYEWSKNMRYEPAAKENLQEIYNVVQHTIKTIYPKYYPTEVVDFFCELHSEEAIWKDIENGDVGILKVDGKIVATGCFVENHITRVYVLPEYQKRGYGTFIIKNIEAEMMQQYDKAFLDASLPAAALYEKLGFITVKHEKYTVKNEVVLVYEIMEKKFHKASTDICYDGRNFIPKMNSENGEVSAQTIFTYHQSGNLLWAEYSGGDIVRGSLIGTVLQNGELDFVYHHMNQDMQIKTGKCHSVPTILESGKIELSEDWEWTSGDFSKGVSVLSEV